MVAVTIANIFRTKGSRPFRIADFIGNDETEQRASIDQALNTLQAMADYEV